MHIYLVVAAWLAVALLAACGIAAVVADWVPRPARRRVVRPRLWGYGSLVSTLGLGLWMFLGPLMDAGLSPLPVIGWCLFMGGMIIQLLAQRPGRGATKTAS
ncbi:hypothetical protein GCM10022403_074400 [Streptomyces coacervatus]|uniref:DUF2516 family protein n=1 Tax=Streptomyces coacervatus TaxID=647381 RepID=A0ABP7IZQ2_9ACTN|nr:hypothetical protein [Streptomyces coacervatus]MDF2270123.1 hypothetical protein [Streptomyces coacervatus]